MCSISLKWLFRVNQPLNFRKTTIDGSTQLHNLTTVKSSQLKLIIGPLPLDEFSFGMNVPTDDNAVIKQVNFDVLESNGLIEALRHQ